MDPNSFVHLDSHEHWSFILLATNLLYAHFVGLSTGINSCTTLTLSTDWSRLCVDLHSDGILLTNWLQIIILKQLHLFHISLAVIHFLDRKLYSCFIFLR